MNYAIVLSPSFKRSVKKLHKRFPTVKQDVKTAIEVLREHPTLGVVIPGGAGVRKFRVKNSDIPRGKSEGYRLLYYVEEQEAGTLYVLLLYAKSDQETISRQEIQQLLKDISIEK